MRPNLDIKTSRDFTFVDFIWLSGLVILMGLYIVLLANGAKRSEEVLEDRGSETFIVAGEGR